MANWCMNQLKFIGDNSLDIIKSHLSLTDNNEMIFDFNKIVEMPKELECSKDSYASRGLKLVLTEKYPFSKYAGDSKNKMSVNEFANYLIRLFGIEVLNGKEHFILSQEEYKKIKNSEHYETYKSRGIQALTNLEQFGYTDWYDWRLDNWGTKWNSTNTIICEDESAVIFDTAWSPPIPIIIALSKKYPDIEIELTYAEEQIGFDTGILRFKNGKSISCNQPKPFSKEAYEIAFSIWGDFDGCYVFDEEQNTYVYADELEKEI